MLGYKKLLLLLCVGFIYHLHPSSLYGNATVDAIADTKQCVALKDKECRTRQHKKQKLEYYLFISDFAKSFIEIPTSNVSEDSTTLNSKYLAGRAVIYNKKNKKAGTCSASFLCMKNKTGIFTDISNYLTINNGLIVSWFTPTKLINLKLDSIIHSMVTKCIVKASTKIGFNPFYGETFNLVVSSDDSRIYFKFTKRS